MATETRQLRAIALDIIQNWPAASDGRGGANTNHPAGAYVDPMLSLADIHQDYGQDSARSIVQYFLSNAGTWRGPEARRIKTELRGMLDR